MLTKKGKEKAMAIKEASKKGKGMAVKEKSNSVAYISLPKEERVKVESIIPVKLLPKKGTTEINIFSSYLNEEGLLIHSLSMVCLVNQARLSSNLEERVKLIGFDEYENFPLEEEGEEVYGVLKVNDSQLLDIQELWSENSGYLTLALYRKSQYVKVWRNPNNEKVSVILSEYKNDTITVVE